MTVPLIGLLNLTAAFPGPRAASRLTAYGYAEESSKKLCHH
ncbi:hypothetical protein [Polymorphobacter sp. PAMC 29334]|nr:hypothetical protein [Polymorphobacter sp. PAMC 29334]